jgi:rhodanese-related sulfurtransferase
MPDHESAADHFRAKLAHETDPCDLRAMLCERDDVVVIDARSEAAYMQEHIPRAMSFPHATMDAASTSKLNRQRLYITYCDGIGCNASTKGALKLAELGFDVKELIGGIEWWKRDGYPTETGSVALNLS